MKRTSGRNADSSTTPGHERGARSHRAAPALSPTLGAAEACLPVRHAPHLILASASPRRVEILRRAGIPCRVRPANVDERLLPGETPRAHVLRLARLKAETVRRPGEWVLGADTVVVIDKKILGKPRHGRDAARMLRLLSGRTHRV